MLNLRCRKKEEIVKTNYPDAKLGLHFSTKVVTDDTLVCSSGESQDQEHEEILSKLDNHWLKPNCTCVIVISGCLWSNFAFLSVIVAVFIQTVDCRNHSLCVCAVCVSQLIKSFAVVGALFMCCRRFSDMFSFLTVFGVCGVCACSKMGDNSTDSASIFSDSYRLAVYSGLSFFTRNTQLTTQPNTNKHQTTRTQNEQTNNK